MWRGVDRVAVVGPCDGGWIVWRWENAEVLLAEGKLNKGAKVMSTCPVWKGWYWKKGRVESLISRAMRGMEAILNKTVRDGKRRYESVGEGRRR